jgi:hypothetical protein
MLAAAAAASLLAAERWHHDRDLRTLDRLERAQAEVVDTTDRRRGQDELTLRFTADGRAVQADVPADTDDVTNEVISRLTFRAVCDLMDHA